MFRNLLFLIFVLLTGCSLPPSSLTVHTDYLSRESLASYYVNTPDPRLNNPPIGQRLIVNWSVPKQYLKTYALRLEMILRFRNREETRLSVPIDKSAGTYIYAVMNEEYLATKGILTYKIDLMADDTLLNGWKHQIWTDLILIEQTT